MAKGLWVHISQLLSIKNVGTLYFVILFCHTVNAIDEAPVTEWDRTYGAIYGWSVCPAGDGGYIIGGTTGDWVDARGGGDWTNHKFSIIKIDSAGEVVWSKNCTSGRLRSAILTSDGGYALAGSGEADLVKTDSEGNIQWNKTYVTLDDTLIYPMIQTSDGGYAILGAGSHPFYGKSEARLVKTDSTGNLQWNKTYGEPDEYDSLCSIVESDGGYVLMGSARDDIWLVKINSEGNVLWEKRYGGQNDESCSYAIRTVDGGYLLVGGTESYGAGDWDGWVVKTDSNGNVQWTRTYGTAGGDIFRAAAICSSGGYVLTGKTDFNSESPSAVVVKLSNSGELVWEKSFPSENSPQSVIVASDGGYIFAAYTKNTDNPECEIWAVKIAPDSSPQEPDVSSVDVSSVAPFIVAATGGVAVAFGLFRYRKSVTK